MYLLHLATIAQGAQHPRPRNCIREERGARFSTQTSPRPSDNSEAARRTLAGAWQQADANVFCAGRARWVRPLEGCRFIGRSRGDTEAQGGGCDLLGAQSQLLARLTT